MKTYVTFTNIKLLCKITFNKQKLYKILLKYETLRI